MLWLYVLASLFLVCVSKPVGTPDCTVAPKTQERTRRGRAFVELYSVNVRAKLAVVGNTVITVPWEKRAEHDMKFEWHQVIEGHRFFFVLGTRTKPKQYLAINASGSVTVQVGERSLHCMVLFLVYLDF